MDTNKEATVEEAPPLAVVDPDETTTFIVRLTRSEHAAFKAKCASSYVTMQAFVKAKIDEFVEAQ